MRQPVALAMRECPRYSGVMTGHPQTFMARVPWPEEPITITFDGGSVVWNGQVLGVHLTSARSFPLSSGVPFRLDLRGSSGLADTGVLGKVLGRKRMVDRLHIEVVTSSGSVCLWAEAPPELLEGIPDGDAGGARVQLDELRYLLHILRAIASKRKSRSRKEPPPQSRLPAPEPVLPPPRKPVVGVAAHWTVLAMACMVYADGEVLDEEIETALSLFRTNPVFSTAENEGLEREFREALDTLKMGSTGALEHIMGRLAVKARDLESAEDKQHALTAVLAIASSDGHFDASEHAMASELKAIVGASVKIPEADPGRIVLCESCGNKLAHYEGYGHWCEACQEYTDPLGELIEADIEIDVEPPVVAEEVSQVAVALEPMPCSECGGATSATEDPLIFGCEACQQSTEPIGSITVSIPEWAELAVRSCPGVDRIHEIGGLARGEQLPLYEDMGEWLRVLWDGGCAYITALYATVQPLDGEVLSHRDPIPCWTCGEQLTFYEGYGYYCQPCEGYTIPIGLVTSVQPDFEALSVWATEAGGVLLGTFDVGVSLLALQHMPGCYRVVFRGQVGFVTDAHVELTYLEHPPVPILSRSEPQGT